ncbi:hypothetical protein V6N13_024655 [Hibiscus sabdariffa]|uniref:Secreted protein n=1 Tax=Hibiscus sabdariffa TaxID=183260 RepID=A0ABR2DVA4_9ROSI
MALTAIASGAVYLHPSLACSTVAQPITSTPQIGNLTARSPSHVNHHTSCTHLQTNDLFGTSVVHYSRQTTCSLVAET